MTRPLTAVERVRPGTAEQLARLAWHRNLEAADRAELDAVAFWILGDVRDAYRVWVELQDDCRQLWHLITDDWDDRDLDELTDADWERFSFSTQQQELDRRYELTRTRLIGDIERQVWLARICAAEVRRAARPAVTA